MKRSTQKPRSVAIAAPVTALPGSWPLALAAAAAIAAVFANATLR